jgi:hypothetical protein
VHVVGEPLLQQWLEISYALLGGNVANLPDLPLQGMPCDFQVQREMPKLWLPLREVQRSICMSPDAPLNGIFVDVFARLQVRSALSKYSTSAMHMQQYPYDASMISACMLPAARVCRMVPARMGAPAGLYPSLLQTSQQQLAGADAGAAQEHVPSTRIPSVP